MLEIIDRLESNVRAYVRQFPTVFATADNARMVDVNGKSFIDFFAGAGALNYGHNNPRSKRALLAYIEGNGVQHSLDMATAAKVNFVRTFDDVILKPRGMDYKLQFTGPTGTNAIEAAIKLARKSKQRSHIVAFTNAYHGHTLGSLALTGNQYYHDDHYGARQNVTHLPFDGYLDGVDSALLLKRMLEDRSSGLPLPAAVIVEPIQCEGGVRVASNNWLRRIESICREYDIALIVDDIQVGNGRTGSFFSFEPSGIKPDLICLSKSIGGGLPMSLLLIRPECDVWLPGQHTGTFRGNNLALIAATAVLEYWRDDRFKESIADRGRVIEQHLRRLAATFATRTFALRGRGMVWGLDIANGDQVAAIIQACFRRGLIIESAGAEGNVLKLLPPLTIELATLEEGLRILEDAVHEVLHQPVVNPIMECLDQIAVAAGSIS